MQPHQINTVKRNRRPASRHRGVVLIITLLAILLIAGLLAYTLNLGDQVAKKIETQNAADAAAIAGATQMARSMNGVAMNNTAMTRNIALINVMDSIPLAVDFSLTEVEESTLADVSAIYQAVNFQIKEGFNFPPLRPAERSLVLREFQKAKEAVGEPGGSNQDKSDEAMLKQMDKYFKQNPQVIQNMTYFKAPSGGPGDIWKALYSLDQYNTTLMSSMGVLAQVNAVETGEENLPKTDAAAAFIAPIIPAIPTKRGSFNDFQRPVLNGLLPTTVDDTLTNRGPWDTIYGFRNRISGGGGNSYRAPHDVLSDPPRREPGVPASEATYPDRYSVFGTQEAQIRAFTRVEEQKYYTRLGSHIRRLANIKAGYIWPKRPNDSGTESLTKINEPDWEVDIEKDDERSKAPKLPNFADGDRDPLRERMDDNFNMLPLVPTSVPANTVYSYVDYNKTLPQKQKFIKETMYLVLDVYHAEKDTAFDPDKRYAGSNDRNKPTDWFIQMHGRFHGRLGMTIRGGFADPRSNSPVGTLRSNIRDNPASPVPNTDPIFKLMYPEPRTGDYKYEPVSPGRRDFYRETLRYETNPWVPEGKYVNGGFPELGLQPIKVGETFIGENEARRLVPVYQARPYYRTRYIFLVGINIGPDLLVRDPYTGFNPADTGAPSPTDLDHAVIGANSTSKQNYLSVLGFARQPAASSTWSSKFKPNQPNPYLSSIAQAKVFNNHSWDLWTQMWEAQLEPVNNVKGWAARMNPGDKSDLSTIGLDSQVVSDTKEFLTSIQDLTDAMISH
jgi:hypothetical protein